MFCARRLTMFLLLTLSASLAHADGLLWQLPKDGSWAVYDLDVNAKAPDGASLNMKGTVYMASVGQATENGLPCRWIEIQLQITAIMGQVKDEKIEVYKLLIPEKYLAKNETPLDHVLQAWIQRGDQKPKKMDNANDIDAGPLPILLSAPWQNVKPLAKAEVECKLGKVACEGVQGNLEFKLNKGEGSMKCDLESRLHADSPFGTTACHWTLHLPEMGETAGMDWNLILADFGENAKSKMPDVK